MVDMQTVDVDNIVEVARKMAAKHNLCGVVDEALKEAGLLKTQSGMLNFSIPVEDFIASVAYGNGGMNLRIHNGSTVIFNRNVTADEVTLVPFTAEQKREFKQKDADRHWLFTSSEGRVTHYFDNPNTSHSAKCGAYPYQTPVAQSPRSENRRCTKCAEAVA